MKRVKSLNGYSIYETTKRDEKDGYIPGEYVIYFSSDIRDFGREWSTPEYEGIETMEEAEELCNNNFAIAKELCENESTCVSFEEIEQKQKEIENAAAAGLSVEEMEEAEELENKSIISPASRCGLVRYSQKTGKIDATLTANGFALLNLWALQNTSPTKETAIFELSTGLIISHVTGRRDHFPAVENGKNRDNIENYCPGLLEAMNK